MARWRQHLGMRRDGAHECALLCRPVHGRLDRAGGRAGHARRLLARRRLHPSTARPAHPVSARGAPAQPAVHDRRRDRDGRDRRAPVTDPGPRPHGGARRQFQRPGQPCHPTRGPRVSLDPRGTRAGRAPAHGCAHLCPTSGNPAGSGLDHADAGDGRGAGDADDRRGSPDGARLRCLRQYGVRGVHRPDRRRRWPGSARGRGSGVVGRAGRGSRLWNIA